MRVIVHGGAGGTADEPTARQQDLDEAVAAGARATDPVAAAVSAAGALESAPRFNAGVGSAVQSDGTIRTDAGLMADDGTTGAACAMAGVADAAAVARLVATETPHVLLAGEHAVALADAYGIETDQNLWTDRTRERWARLDAPAVEDSRDDGSVVEDSRDDGSAVEDSRLDAPAVEDSRDDGSVVENPREHLAWVREQFGGSDTIGAVATDGSGVAVVTSTGGRWCALAGRVGDVPQVGAGFYAEGGVAASATGAGEAIARSGLARRAVDLAQERPPQLAADRAIDAFEGDTGAQAGVIVLDTAGRTGSSYNSAEMLTAVRG
jgi:beta-aspartyl-peptidase (threonine type)